MTKKRPGALGAFLAPRRFLVPSIYDRIKQLSCQFCIAMIQTFINSVVINFQIEYDYIKYKVCIKQDRKTIHTLMSCLTSLLIPEIALIPARFLQYNCKIPTRYLQIPARYLQIPVSLCKILLIIYRKSLQDPFRPQQIPADPCRPLQTPADPSRSLQQKLL